MLKAVVMVISAELYDSANENKNWMDLEENNETILQNNKKS